MGSHSQEYKEPALRRAVARTVSLLAAITIVGCGADGNTKFVTGKITVKGQPVTHGIINFQTEGRRPFGGGIGSDGTYSVELPPGEYKVRIDAPPQVPEGYKEGDPLPRLGPQLVPEKYANFNSSGLTATVADEGQQTIDFNLP